MNGLYETELIHTKRRWESTKAVELATMGWVRWWNTARLHEALDYRTPQKPRPPTLTTETKHPWRPDLGTKPRTLQLPRRV